MTANRGPETADQAGLSDARAANGHVPEQEFSDETVIRPPRRQATPTGPQGPSVHPNGPGPTGTNGHGPDGAHGNPGPSRFVTAGSVAVPGTAGGGGPARPLTPPAPQAYQPSPAAPSSAGHPPASAPGWIPTGGPTPTPPSGAPGYAPSSTTGVPGSGSVPTDRPGLKDRVGKLLRRGGDETPASSPDPSAPRPAAATPATPAGGAPSPSRAASAPTPDVDPRPTLAQRIMQEKPAQPVTSAPSPSDQPSPTTPASAAPVGAAAAASAVSPFARPSDEASRPGATAATPQEPVPVRSGPHRGEADRAPASGATPLAATALTAAVSAPTATGADVTAPTVTAPTSVAPTSAPPTGVAPATTAQSGIAEPAQAAPAATAKSTKAPVRRTRKARLRLTRIDPWSVMKTAFLFSFAAGIVLVAAVFLIWVVLSGSGLFGAVNTTVQDLFGSQNDTTPFMIETYVDTSRVLGAAFVVAVVDVVLITAIATLVSFLYNLAATVIGGLEVTLAED